VAIKIYKSIDASGNPVGPIDIYSDSDTLPVNYINLYGEAGIVQRADLLGISRVANPSLLYLANDDPDINLTDVTLHFADFGEDYTLPSPLAEFYLFFEANKFGYTYNTNTGLYVRNATYDEYETNSYSLEGLPALSNPWSRNEYTVPSGKYPQYEKVLHLGYYTVTDGVTTYVPYELAHGEVIPFLMRASLPSDFSLTVYTRGSVCASASEVV